MDQELTIRFDNLERIIGDYITASDKKIARVDGRIDALEAKVGDLAEVSRQMHGDLGMSMKLLDKLLKDKDAVLRRDTDRCALKNESVAAAAKSSRYTRMALLKSWEQIGRLYTSIEDGRRRYTTKITVGGERPRAIIIINK